MDSTDRYKPIAPASDESGLKRSVPDPRRRRQAVPVACIQCRTGKAKCDGTRPACNRCRDNDVPCQYDVAEGVSRAERMKMLKRDGMAIKVEELERIINALRSGTDLHASTVLARLRLGERLGDVAKSLPPTSLQARSNSLPAPSTGVSAGLGNQELRNVSNVSGVSSMFSPSSTISRDMHTTHQSAWQESTTLASSSDYASASRGRQTSVADITDEQSFFSILFDRNDYLLARGDTDDESDKIGNTDERLDARLPLILKMGQVPTEPSGSGAISPKRKQSVRSIHATHLISRQPIVNAVSVHPNLNLRNFFGSTSLSGIGPTDHHTLVSQNAFSNLTIPTWAMMTMNSRPDPGSLHAAFEGILQEARGMIQRGTLADLVIEKHPNIAALFNESEYNNSGILSKWSAGMVHSVQLRNIDFTCMASMYVFWYLMRWMIYPSPETYDCIPDWLRPTPNQLFMPHIKILDFVIWPAFRELAVQIPAMQERMEWLMDMCNTVRCDWSFSTKEALSRNEETGHFDLCPMAKACVRDMSNWSLGPSFRGYVSNADSYVRVRAETG